jgi:hypothetical protein
MVPVAESHTLGDDVPDFAESPEPEVLAPPEGTAPRPGFVLRFLRAFA